MTVRTPWGWRLKAAAGLVVLAAGFLFGAVIDGRAPVERGQGGLDLAFAPVELIDAD